MITNRSVRRAAAWGLAPVAVVGLAVGCSSSSNDSTSTTTAAAKTSTTSAAKTTVTTGSAGSTPVISGVAAPVVLSPTETTTSVKVGTVVTFNMGDPKDGSYVAVSDNPTVFVVDSVGATKDGVTTNAGGKAVGVGTAKVSVSFRGATNGVGTPTTFTITVTA